MNKKILIPVIFVLLAGLAVVGLEKLNLTNFFDSKNSSQTTTGPTEQEKQAEDTANANVKKQLIESELNDKGQAPANDSTPQTASIELYAQQENNGTITVFTKLFGTTSGSCTLTVTNSTQQSSQTALVVFQPEYSSCAGFSVNKSDLGSGNWNITLSVNSNGQTTTKNISYQVQ